MRVDVGRYVAYHPAAEQLKRLDQELGQVTRSTPAGHSGVQVPAPEAQELPMPAPAGTPAAPLGVDQERAAAEIRRDFEMRREALPLPAPEEPEPLPQVREKPDPQPVTPPEPERGTGLDEQISRLNQQLERLRERPEDRLIYTPAQLRRRRELFELTRSELSRLHQEQVSRLRQAVAPRERTSPQRRPRPEKPRLVERPTGLTPEQEQQLRAREETELQVVRNLPALPSAQGTPPAAPPEEVHDEVREAMRAKVESVRDTGQRGPGAAPELYVSALRKRRESLRAAILKDVTAAATVAARERGWTLTEETGAPDRTAALLERVRAAINLEGRRVLGAKR